MKRTHSFILFHPSMLFRQVWDVIKIITFKTTIVFVSFLLVVLINAFLIEMHGEWIYLEIARWISSLAVADRINSMEKL